MQLAEFRTPESICRGYPDRVRKLAAGVTWNKIAGQLTDDSEMALMLARKWLNKALMKPRSDSSVYWALIVYDT